MYFEQFYLTCLAHASYMIGSEGEAAVVDPQRDVDIYLKVAEEQGLRIRHIFETHLHADFVSGHKELAARTGAQIYIGAQAQAQFPHVALRDGFEVKVGAVRMWTLETPGHTPESVCLVITDEGESSGEKAGEKMPQPCAVLTGDTLFIGDVGRPDLSPSHTPRELAGMLYDSLHRKLMALPDGVKVYPAHGAGSLCGRAMRAERSSTIGTERVTNYALQIKSREEFVGQLTCNLPARPEYFLEDAEINRSGATLLTELAELATLSPAEVQGVARENGWLLDVRAGDDYAAGHVPGSINVALSGQFASWAGGILGIHSRPVLIGDSEAQIEEARLRLARVGIEDVRGYLAGGMAAWRGAGRAVTVTPQISAAELNLKLRSGEMLAGDVLDVRREGEWQAGHIPDARWQALDTFPGGLPEVGRERAVAVHCKSGYRSMIACGMLERAGHRNMINVAGGFDAWHAAGLPEVAEQLVKA